MDDDDDGVELRDDGRIGLHMGEGVVIVLRRPKVGEMRLLHEAADAASEKFKVQEARASVMFSDDGPWREWFDLLVSTLGDREAPEADERPAWASSFDLPSKLLPHWRTVPLVLGGGGN